MLSDLPEVLRLIGVQSGSSLGLTLGVGEDSGLYEYDARNRMINAQSNDSTVTNTFNAEGYRLTKTTEDGVSTFGYEYTRVTVEQNADSSVSYNVYGTRLISRQSGNDKAYYLYNGHGDVTALIDSSGNVMVSYYYDAFGVIVEQTGGYGNPFR